MSIISLRSRVCLFARSSGVLVQRPLCGAVLSLALSSVVSLSHAETPSFATLLLQAQGNAPHLLEHAANVRAANADALQARVWNNPILAMNAENLGAPQSNGTSQRQDTYTLTQVFEIGGKRSARIEVEQRKATAIGLRERETGVVFANALAIAYGTAEAMQEKAQVADSEMARAKDDLRAAQALVASGREAELRLAQARASVAAALASVESSSADALEAFEQLSALVGVSEPFTRIEHSLLKSGMIFRLTPQWTSDQAPALISAVAERDTSEAQVRLEEKRWLPDIGVSIGVRRFDGSSQAARTLGVSANIPIFDRNQSGTSAARERAAGAAHRVAATRLETVASHRSAMA